VRAGPDQRDVNVCCGLCVAGGSHVGHRHACVFPVALWEQYMYLTFTADRHVFYIQTF
jgi:hypothetical protein